MNILERIVCNNFIVKDGYAYLSNCLYNGLFTVEIKTGKTSFLGCFEGEKISKNNIHKEIFLKDEKLYICPWKGRHVHIWDLEDQTLYSVEIRTKDEQSVFVDKVVLGEKDVFFLPDKKNAPVKVMNLESLKVTELKDKSEIQGKDIFEHKDFFPVSDPVEKWGKWGIEYTDRFFWRQLLDGWYAFWPLGCHMMRYVEGTDELEMIPLTIVNAEELEKYLHDVRLELLHETPVSEDVMKLETLLDDMKIGESYKSNDFREHGSIGNRIWKCMGGNGK